MSVFKIQQSGIVMQDEKGTINTLESDKTLNAEGNPDAKPQGEETSSEGGEKQLSLEPNLDNKDKGELMVKIDGPVGRIFTDALNKMLVQESYMTMSPALFESKDQEDHQNDEDEAELQIYCWKGDELNMKDVTMITDDIAKNTNRDFIIAIESVKVTPAMSMLGDLLKLKNVQICFSQERALELVKSRIKK